MTKKRNVVMFVDDEKICHTFVELVLLDFPHLNLVSAFNGEEALEVGKKHANEIGLILCDVMLPDMDGRHIWQILKKEKNLENIPFIFQTGMSSGKTTLSQVSEDNVFILPKPYSRKDLVGLLSKL